MHLYAQKCQICKISLHICNRDFMNQIGIIIGYNFGCAKKIRQVINIREALVITNRFIHDKQLK
jgi:hypothetical protein